LQGFDHCAYVTWSTGIGVGLCVDGRILRGKNGNAGHAGHMFVSADEGAALCGCGNVGDVEGLVAGNALARRFGADAVTLFTRAKAGDANAQATVEELCRVLGRALYNLIATLDLQRISLGGGVFWNNRDYLLPRLSAQVAGKFPALTAGSELVGAGLEDRVGDYAALALLG
jgi:glucokinase